MTDVTANLNLPPDPPEGQQTSFNIPATPLTPAATVSDIPTITLPLSKATKAHVAAAVASVTGAGELVAQFLPDGPVRTYIVAGVAVVGIGAIWLGVYVAPNLPKITVRR